MWKKVLAGFAGLIVLGLVVVGMQPEDYRVVRSTTINAPAAIVWGQVADFGQWKNWSHWDKSDPTQKTTESGTPGTVGHQTVWNGEKTGQGSMTVVGATSPSVLNIKLVFTSPMASEAKTDMKIEGTGAAVTVTWSMDGKNNFAGKFFGLVMGMEKMIGKAYEDSLANLKQVAEEQAKAANGRG